MSDTAWIVHQLAGRVRLRLPHRRKDVAFFQQAIEHLDTLPGLERAKANPATGSLLVEFDEGSEVFTSLETYLRAQDIDIDYGDPPMAAARPTIKHGIKQVDDYIGLLSEQATDLRSIGVLFFLALSVLQMARGQTLAPASTLLWYALYLLNGSDNSPSGD